MRLEQSVYKGRALQEADRPGVTISFLRDPAVPGEWEAGRALWAFHLGETTGDPDE